MSAPETREPRLPSRRQFLSLGIGAFLVASVPLARRSSGPARVRRALPMMGTTAEILVVHGDERYAQAGIDAAFAELTGVERSMSRFRADSDVGRANLAGPAVAVPIGPATVRVIGEALRWADASDGAFDPCLARATELWDVGSRTAPPPAEAVRRLAGRALYRAVELDRLGSSAVILIHDGDAALDLGGIAKGYGVDRAAAALRDWGITRALVNVGGDIYALGTNEGGEPWEVGIRSPHDPSALAGVLRLADRAVATSGDYSQFFDHAGNRYHHLLDPSTAAPRRTALHTLTVSASSCMAADAAATACFGSPSDSATRLLAKIGGDAEIVHLG